MTILVTGGAGYIGSHTVLSLLREEHEVVVYDNLSNSQVESLCRVEAIAGKSLKLIRGDVRDKEKLRAVFKSFYITSVIHFAAMKSVAESIEKPIAYYQNNISGTLSLLEVMAEYHVHDFVFSSSATVYGENAAVPYVESMDLGDCASPYGTSKCMVEKILQDHGNSNHNFRAISLRYFNPIGAHESGLIGEDPKGIPNNLLPYIAQVAVGKREKLTVFGNDYPTHDGTCERDYLHVMDLAEGHVAAINWLNAHTRWHGLETFNLGTGKAYSVLQIIAAFEEASGQHIPYVIGSRRSGDLPAFWACPDKANKLLNWKARRSITQMMSDSWRWQHNNPEGFQTGLAEFEGQYSVPLDVDFKIIHLR